MINIYSVEARPVDIKWIEPSEIPNYEFCPADDEILKKIKLVYGV